MFAVQVHHNVDQQRAVQRTMPGLRKAQCFRTELDVMIGMEQT